MSALNIHYSSSPSGASNSKASICPKAPAPAIPWREPYNERDPTYIKRMKKLDTRCKYQDYPTLDDDNRFIQTCQSAKIIPVKYRREIFRLPCHYFKAYPGIMKQYMPLYVRINTYRHDNAKEKAQKRIEKKLRKVVRPILKELKRAEISCYIKANTLADQQDCSLKYISNIDTLFITDLSSSYNDAVYLYGTKEQHKKEAEERKRRLTAQEKEKAVKKAREELRKGDLIPGDYKLYLP